MLINANERIKELTKEIDSLVWYGDSPEDRKIASRKIDLMNERNDWKQWIEKEVL